ncbi:MAG: hypothetical protein ABF306_09785 [Nocardioides marinisabuli]|uniref:hypothetical protein n=1 Tax=Nocardioides marinisabuli TaxID=419476 RepID=UPI00321B4F48
MRPLGTLLHLPAALLVATSLVACGGDPEPRGADGTAASVGDSDETEPVVLRQRLVTATDAGEGPGEVAGEVAVAVGDDAAMDAFTADLGKGFADDVVEAADALEVGGDEELAAQVVAIGCDEPTSVTARRTPAGVVLEPGPGPSPGRQCFAAMTTVAVVVLEAGTLSAG